MKRSQRPKPPKSLSSYSRKNKTPYKYEHTKNVFSVGTQGSIKY